MPYPMRLIDKKRLKELERSEKILKDIRKNLAACQKAIEGKMPGTNNLVKHLKDATYEVDVSLTMIASERASVLPSPSEGSA